MTQKFVKLYWTEEAPTCLWFKFVLVRERDTRDFFLYKKGRPKTKTDAKELDINWRITLKLKVLGFIRLCPRGVENAWNTISPLTSLAKWNLTPLMISGTTPMWEHLIFNVSAKAPPSLESSTPRTNFFVFLGKLDSMKFLRSGRKNRKMHSAQNHDIIHWR